MSIDILEKWFKANKNWADSKKEEHPSYFDRLASGQEPEMLWIGCSDSRVDPGKLLQMEPGSIFTHRNIANLIHAGDANLQSVIQYAVDALQVPHIVVCGHYNCGGVKAAAEGEASGVIAHWLQPIANLYLEKEEELKTISDSKNRLNRLSELNVIRQVGNLTGSPTLINAWQRNQNLTVHGWVFELSTGYIKEVIEPVTG